MYAEDVWYVMEEGMYPNITFDFLRSAAAA